MPSSGGLISLGYVRRELVSFDDFIWIPFFRLNDNPYLNKCSKIFVLTEATEIHILTNIIEVLNTIVKRNDERIAILSVTNKH